MVERLVTLTSQDTRFKFAISIVVMPCLTLVNVDLSIVYIISKHCPFNCSFLTCIYDTHLPLDVILISTPETCHLYVNRALSKQGVSHEFIWSGYTTDLDTSLFAGLTFIILMMWDYQPHSLEYTCCNMVIAPYNVTRVNKH